MQLCVLGSGTVVPTPDRTSPAHWVEAGPVRLLMDCGPGALHRCASFGIPWPGMTHVALTHFHTDHWSELPHLLFALRWGTEPARRDLLTVIGPPGLRERMSHLASGYGDWMLDPGFPLRLEEITAGKELTLGDGVELTACDTPHTEESLAFAIRHRGASLVYTGDTGPSTALARWAHGCDLLLAECSLPEERAIDIHLTPRQAGALARDAQARRLVLTHFYPPVLATEDPVALATELFEGDILAARDGDRFKVEAE